MRVNIVPWKIGGVIATVLFAGCLVGSCVIGEWLAALMFIPFFLPSLLLLLCYGPIQVDAQGVTTFTPMGKYAIRWEEVRRIRHAKSHLVFEGDEKRLTVPLPLFWNGRNKKGALQALETFIRESGITPAYSFSADFILSKNAKVV
jgi:hypothetical protein